MLVAYICICKCTPPRRLSLARMCTLHARIEDSLIENARRIWQGSSHRICGQVQSGICGEMDWTKGTQCSARDACTGPVIAARDRVWACDIKHRRTNLQRVGQARFEDIDFRAVYSLWRSCASPSFDRRQGYVLSHLLMLDAVRRPHCPSLARCLIWYCVNTIQRYDLLQPESE